MWKLRYATLLVWISTAFLTISEWLNIIAIAISKLGMRVGNAAMRILKSPTCNHCKRPVYQDPCRFCGRGINDQV